MDEHIVIGEIIKPQGLSGEVKIKPITNDVLRFKKLRAVYIDTALCQISSIRIEKDFVFIRFAGITDRDGAEQIVGKYIKIDRFHSIATDDDEFFIADLIGCGIDSVEESFNGMITNVWQHGAADVIEVKLACGGTLLFPFLKSLKMQLDTEKKKVQLDLDVLKSIAVINN